MTFEKKYLLKNLFLTCLIVLLVVLFIFITYSIRQGNASKNVLTDVMMIDEESYGNTTLNSDNLKMVPILDKNVNSNSSNVMYISFNVGGSKENKNVDIIYDIALVDLNLDCDLLSPYLKWKLVKNGTQEYVGSFDYRFDTIKNNRLVLTDIQQDLVPYSDDKSTYDHYDFYMWLSDSCQEEDILLCKNHPSQDNLMNKKISGKIEVELYGDDKSALVRTPSDVIDTSTCISAK